MNRWLAGLLCSFFAVLGSGVPPAASQTLMNGAGATFPYPIYSKWFDEYAKVDPSVRFNYQSIGSGGGIRQITARTVDFGASDGPMNDDQLRKAPGDLLHIPTVLGAVVATYNLPGHSKLRFTPDVLADIFLGKITKWNDARIAAANPGASLPDQAILVVHRSDGSGTTYIWVDYLAKVSKEWDAKVGRGTSVNWPVGLGGKGNEGVAGQIKSTPGRSATSSWPTPSRTRSPRRRFAMPREGSSCRASRRRRPRRPASRRTCPPTSASRSRTRPATTRTRSPASPGSWSTGTSPTRRRGRRW